VREALSRFANQRDRAPSQAPDRRRNGKRQRVNRAAKATIIRPRQAVKREAEEGLGTVKNEDRIARLLARTLFPRAEDIPQSLAIAFMRMMMAHASFESEVRALQGVITKDQYYGEQPKNLWRAKERPKRMVKLIEEHLGQIPETDQIRKLLEDACDPTNKRNHLAHGSWWAFDPSTATIDVRGGTQREDEDQFNEYSEETISAIADRFETLEADLYKLRRGIENQHGDERL